MIGSLVILNNGYQVSNPSMSTTGTLAELVVNLCAALLILFIVWLFSRI